MEEENSWVSHGIYNYSIPSLEFDSFSDLHEQNDKGLAAVYLDLIVPDDLLERILAYLPIASIFRAGSVCKRWRDIVTSKRFIGNYSRAVSPKPWYFMFTSSDEPVGNAYDPVLRKWHNIDLPCIDTSNWFIASSCGLVCFMDNDRTRELYVCNPITFCWRAVVEPPGPRFSDYRALAISVDRASHYYKILIVKSRQVPGDLFQWNLSIYMYQSQAMTWGTILTESLTGWRAGDESVICDGVLYFLIYSTGGGYPENRHGLITYNLGSGPSNDLLMKSFIAAPCSLTCGRLMNLKEKLVLVGGIGKPDRPGVIKGIGIWALKSREWQEIARMPNKYFYGFGEFDDVFASSGADDLVYIQSYGAPALLIFDLSLKQWKWSQKSPVTKKFPLQLFTGFCFEARLEISP
ncbi:hypothetical protein F511_03123 [Dorcoceras hygrometricum]|nr:hypothetical protein F511_03123 [Dorcoceras hygrometricum]